MRIDWSAVGGITSAFAVVLATVELRLSDKRARKSRDDLFETRLVDFQLAQLVSLSEVLGQSGRSVDWLVKVRLRLLPADLLPTLEEWVTAPDERDLAVYKGPYMAALNAAIADGQDGLDWGSWARERVRDEIDAAVEVLLLRRPA